METNTRVVVCAAVRWRSTGAFVCGPRHGHCLNAMVTTYDGYNCSSETCECGFVDQHNQFMTRQEAWKVADAAGQIRRPTGYEKDYSNQRPPNIGDEGMLFSENLY